MQFISHTRLRFPYFMHGVLTGTNSKHHIDLPPPCCPPPCASSPPPSSSCAAWHTASGALTVTTTRTSSSPDRMSAVVLVQCRTHLSGKWSGEENFPACPGKLNDRMASPTVLKIVPFKRNPLLTDFDRKAKKEKKITTLSQKKKTKLVHWQSRFRAPVDPSTSVSASRVTGAEDLMVSGVEDKREKYEEEGESMMGTGRREEERRAGPCSLLGLCLQKCLT